MGEKEVGGVSVREERISYQVILILLQQGQLTGVWYSSLNRLNTLRAVILR